MVSILKEKSLSPFLKDTPEGQDRTEDNEEDIEAVTEDKTDKEDHTIATIKALTVKQEAEGEEAGAEAEAEEAMAEETLVKVDNQDLKANKDNKGRNADSTETTGADKEEAAADIETIDKDNNLDKAKEVRKQSTKIKRLVDYLKTRKKLKSKLSNKNKVIFFIYVGQYSKK